MSQWNPNSDCVTGLEWAPVRQIDRPVAGRGTEAVAWTLASDVTEDVTSAWTFASGQVQNAYDTLDVYDTDAMPRVDLRVKRSWYTAGSSFGQVRQQGGLYYTTLPSPYPVGTYNVGGNTPTYYSYVNSPTYTAGSYQGLSLFLGTTWANPVFLLNRNFFGLTTFPEQYASSVARWAQWSFHANSLAPSGTPRITGLTVGCVAQRLVEPLAVGSEQDQPYRIRPALLMLRPGSSTQTLFMGQYRFMPNSPEVVSYTWPLNPVTNRPWTVTDLGTFANGGTSAISWFMSRPDDGAVIAVTAGAVYEAWADVSYGTETRVAIGARKAARQVPGWNGWDLTTTTGATWSKQADKQYLFVQSYSEQEAVDRQPTGDPRGLTLRALGGNATGASLGVQEVTPDYSEVAPYRVGAETGYHPAFLLQNSEGLLSGSQPYAVGGGGYEAIVGPGEERLATLAGAFTIGESRGRLWLRGQAEQRPDAALVMTFYAFVDDEILPDPVAVGRIEPDQVARPSVYDPIEFALLNVDGPWPSGTAGLLISFGYEGTSGNGWDLLVATTGAGLGVAVPPSVSLAEMGFGGTGVLWLDPTYNADVALVLGNPPSAPTGVSAVAELMPTGTPGVVLSVPIAADNECDTYQRVQVERLNDGQWSRTHDVVVDNVADLAIVVDVEVPRNAEVSYRVRGVGASGFESEWTETEPVELQDTRCGYVIASNHVNLTEALPVWYDDLAPRIYLPVETVRFVRFEGQDGSSPLRTDQDELEAFTATLLVAADGAASSTPTPDQLPAQGRAAFDPLLWYIGNKRMPDGTLLRPPYVAVADNDGRVWYGVVSVSSLQRLEPGGQYTAAVRVEATRREPLPSDQVFLEETGS
jgi:hypothetical protein